MKLFLILAWRNIWRNKRRTLIASSSVFFAVLLALVMRSLQYGSYDFMIDSALRIYTGYMQIHGKGYWDDRSLEKSFTDYQSLINRIEKIGHVELAIPRLENFLLVSSNDITKIASVICIDPVKEDSMTRLKQKLIDGKYLSYEDQGILIAEGLANLLKVKTGDTVILYGQGIYGMIVAVNCPIIGVVKFSLPEINNSFIYMPLRFGQNLFGMENKITSISIMLDNPREMDQVYANVKSLITEDLELMKWEELLPELVQGIQLDNVGGMIMLFILYLIIAFGILGTIMMMTAERTKEFGILISIGMKKSRLVLITTLESIFISLLGAIAGVIVSIPILFYLNNNPIKLTGELAEISLKFGVEPILPFSIEPKIFFAQTGVVLIIALITAIYPVNYIRKIKPTEAMRI